MRRVVEKLDALQEITNRQYREICDQKNAVEVLKTSHDELVRSFEKFQLRSDLLQERTTEMFGEIKSEIVKNGATFEAYRAEQQKQIENLKDQDNNEHNVKSREKWDKLLWNVGISFVGFLLGMLYHNIGM